MLYVGYRLYRSLLVQCSTGTVKYWRPCEVLADSQPFTWLCDTTAWYELSIQLPVPARVPVSVFAQRIYPPNPSPNP